MLCFGYANITGRRWTIAIGCMVLLVGAALQAASFSVAQFIGMNPLSLHIGPACLLTGTKWAG